MCYQIHFFGTGLLQYAANPLFKLQCIRFDAAHSVLSSEKDGSSAASQKMRYASPAATRIVTHKKAVDKDKRISCCIGALLLRKRVFELNRTGISEILWLHTLQVQVPFSLWSYSS